MSRNISANSVVNAARRQGTRRAGRLSIVPRQRDTLIAIHHGLLLFLVHSAGDFVTRQPGHRIIDLSLRLLATLATVYGFRIDRSISFLRGYFEKIECLGGNVTL